MADLIPTKSFTKQRISNKMHEDPTYLSFFFMFDWYDKEHSPLLSGETELYLRQTVGDDERADALNRFVNILKKLNKELPWFWQSISGLETTKQYNKMEDPFRGGSDKRLEVKCLESVELTVTGLIDLYKKAVFDFDRWVEVVPMNMRLFRMHVFVQEVRTFKTNKGVDFVANAIDSTNVTGNASASGILSSTAKDDIRSVKPFFQIELGHCTFDIESTNTVFQDLSKSPDSAVAPSIFINYEIVRDVDSQYANSIPNSQAGSDLTAAELLAQGAVDAIVGAASNKAEGLLQSTLDNAMGQLLLGNVYGSNSISNIQDAIAAGSINAVANLAGQVEQPRPSPPTYVPDNVYPDPTQVKDLPIEPKNTYGNQTQERDQTSAVRGTGRPQTSQAPRDLGNANNRRV